MIYPKAEYGSSVVESLPGIERKPVIAMDEPITRGPYVRASARRRKGPSTKQLKKMLMARQREFLEVAAQSTQRLFGRPTF